MPRSFVVASLLALALAACGDDRAGTLDSGARADGSSVADTGVAPPEPTSLSVATFNVHNLFDEVDDPDTLDEVLSADAVSTKLDNVGRVIRALDADVVVLEEVENAALLDRLADGPLAGAGYAERILVDADDPRGIDVACLSRVPVDRFETHHDELFSSPDGSIWGFARDALELFLTVGTTPVVLIGLHLRAKSDADADEHRLAEALRVRRLVDTRVDMGTARVVVLGDLNDTPGSPALGALLDGDSLVDTTTSIPEADRWTFDFQGRREQIDHLLATPALALEVVEPETTILHGAEVDTASDHQPVYARFLVQPE